MENNTLAVVETTLGTMLKQKSGALPESFNQTRFVQNCLSALSDIKDIDQVTPVSIAKTLLKGAFLGLDFFNRECYAIPYNKNIGTKESPKYVKELQFQTDYKGDRKLAKLYSVFPIKDIYAVLIREGDNPPMINIVNGEQHLTFSASPLNFTKKIVGVLGVILYQDGTYYYDIMDIAEVEHIRKAYSKIPNSPAWEKSHGEMVKKTMLRRLNKQISLNFKNADQDESYQDGGEAKFVEYEEVKVEIKTPKPVARIEKETAPTKEATPTKKPTPDEAFKIMKEFIGLGRIAEVKAKIVNYDFSPEQLGELNKLIEEGGKHEF